MRICGWCGVRLRFRVGHCRECAKALAYSHPSPPCPKMARFEHRDWIRSRFGPIK
jgi:hypothetical protein